MPDVCPDCNQPAHELTGVACRPADVQMRRLVEAERTEVVYPHGIATRVPRDKCRCPILAVGDFCPVHGG